MRIAFLVWLALAALSAPAARAANLPGGCPDSRAYLDPQLKTTPQDGSYYSLQREAVEMPIDEVVDMMGGTKRAYAIAYATRQAAEDLLQAEVNASERRHLDDTILRADALIAILDCRRSTTDA